VLISNIQVFHLDTITSPLNILDPLDWNKLFQTLTFANETRNLQLSTSVLMDIGDELSPLAMKNHLDISIEIPRTSISFGVSANMEESAFLDFPMVDIANPFCWLGTLAPYTVFQDSGASTTLNPLVIDTLTFLVDTFHLSSKCLNCTSAGAFALSDILQSDLPTVGFQEVFSARIFKLLEDMVWNLWRDHDLKDMFESAAQKCPKRTSDGRILAPSQERTFEMKSARRKSLLEIQGPSRDSLETLVGLSMVGLHVIAIVVAKNHGNPVEEEFSANHGVSITEELGNRNDLLDWTNLSGDIGQGADFAFQQLRRFLAAKVDNEADDGNVKSIPRIIKLLRPLVLDQKGAYVINFEGFDGAIKALNFEVAASQVELLGLQNMLVSEFLFPIKPQVLRSKFILDELTVIIDSRMHLGDTEEDFEFIFVGKNVTMQIDLLLAFDLQAFESLQLGSLFQIKDIVPCATTGLRDFRVQELLITMEEFDGPKIKGFSNNDFLISVNSMIHNLSTRHKKDFQLMHGFFNNTIKEIVNSLLPEWINATKSNCPPPPQYPADGVVDFRDLLLPSNASRSLGGTGVGPYGNLFALLYGYFLEHVSRMGDSHVINDIFQYIAVNQSNTHGGFQLDGNAFSSKTKINVAGLRADLDVQVSNVTLKNIDSIGVPFELMMPIENSADTVRNVLSFGVDSRSMQMAATVYFSLSDGGKTVTSVNESVT
jgi:hypothetical protein